MLQSLVTQLWSTQTAKQQQLLSEASSPGKSSTCASVNEVENDDDDDVGTSEWRASLWSVDGTDAKELLINANITFEENQLVLNGEIPSETIVEEKDEGGDIVPVKMKKMKFNCLTMSHFRQHQCEMFQWVMKQNNDAGEEYGLMFSSKHVAFAFNSSMLPRIRANAKCLSRVPVEYREYEREAKVWKTIEKFASFSILQRANDFEAFVVVEETEDDSEGGKKEQKAALCDMSVSSGDYIFPQPSENQIVWWGFDKNDAAAGDDEHDDDECGGRRKMLAASFLCGEEETKRILQLLEHVLHEHSEGKKVENLAIAYDDDAFEGVGKKKQNNDGAATDEDDHDEMKWEDAEEEESEIVSMDITRHKLMESPPDALFPKAMQVGKDHTVIVKGSPSTGKAQFDVVKFDECGKNNVVATIDEKKLNYNGENLSPSKTLLLHDYEKKVLTTDEDDPRYVYLVDLQCEKLVQKWDASHMPIQNIIPSSKNAAKTGEPTFLGINSRAFYLMDTREKGASGRGTTYAYSSNVQFTSGATDADRHVLLASKLGQLRLYDGEANKEGKFKRAKTQLMGLGDPIIHVDVTSDGSWILGTCENYLILYPVRLAKSHKTGFVTALGKKPRPIKLKLSFDDLVKYKMQNVCFAKAEFDAEEKTIVSATGNLVIVWDFEGLKRKGLPSDGSEVPYGIRVADDCVTEVAFLDSAGEAGFSSKDRESTVVMATMKGVSSKKFMRKTV